jgi:hypothetical protein
LESFKNSVFSTRISFIFNNDSSDNTVFVTSASYINLYRVFRILSDYYYNNNINYNESTSSTTGALVVAGGVGISKSLNVGGILKANSVTASTSSTTGALVVAGGIGIGGDLYLGGNFYAGPYSPNVFLNPNNYMVINETNNKILFSTFTNLINSKTSKIHVKLIGPGGGGGTSTGSSMGSGGGSGSYYEGILDILDRTNSYEPKIYDHLFVYVGKGGDKNYNTSFNSEAYKTYIGRTPILPGGGFGSEGSERTIVYAYGGTQGKPLSTTQFLTEGGYGGGLMTPNGLDDSYIVTSRLDIVNSIGQNGGNAYRINENQIIYGIGGKGHLGNIGGGGNQNQPGSDGIAIISW